jgi:PAS domain S-box-containing protein
MRSAVSHTIRPIHLLQRFAFSLLLPLLALILSLALDSIIRQTPFALFYGAVALAAWLGGLPAGLLATLVSMPLAQWVLTPRLASMPFYDADYAHLIAFAAVASLIAWLNHARRVSINRAESMRREMHALMDNMGDAMTAQDSTGKVVFANRAAAELTGYPSVEAMLSQSVQAMQRRYALFDLDGKPMSYDQLPRQQVFRDGKSGEVHFRLRHVDSGNERWIHLISAPVLGVDGKPRLAVNIFRDITHSVQEQKRLQQILDNLPALVSMLTPDGVLIEANRIALSLANLTREQVIGKPFDQTYWWAYDPNVQVRLRDAIQRARGGEVVRYDATVRIGEERFATLDFTLSPIYDETGAVTALLPSALDISERISAERERARLNTLIDNEHRRLENILAHIPGVVWEGVRKPDGSQKLLYVNPYAERLLGIPLSRWYAEPPIWEEIVHPDDMPAAIEQATRIYESRQPGTMEFRLRTATGRTVPVESHASIIPLHGSDGEIHISGVMMDISQRKRSEALAARYMQRLRTSNLELQQFAYVASHDLQEPLRMISSYLQLIEARYKDALDDDGRDFIGFAVDGANRMKRLIQDLLAYSRVETRRGQLTLVNMNEVVEQIRADMALTISETGAQLHAADLPVITADPNQMIQLLQNLIANAIKFRGDAPPEVHIRAEKVPGAWQFSVQDNGIGIDPQYHQRIFAIFQRLHGHGKYPGTGIGLAICKRVAERHGGTIGVNSSPGAGATFFFTIADDIQSTDEGDTDEFAQ